VEAEMTELQFYALIKYIDARIELLVAETMNIHNKASHDMDSELLIDERNHAERAREALRRELGLK
jgi:hypothetical protein